VRWRARRQLQGPVSQRQPPVARAFAEHSCCSDFNVRTGAKFFSDSLSGNNGNLLLTMGGYNGWFKGMTVVCAFPPRMMLPALTRTQGDATKMQKSSCCRCQQNLDYLQQWLNGWMRNVNAYQNNLGFYHNLDVCGN
jgi:hypothetical protein